MQKFNIPNKAAAPAYLLLTLCTSLLIVSCSSEEPTLEFSEEFISNTAFTASWATDSEDAPIRVDFYNYDAEPNAYYKLIRSTNSDCDIQNEITCSDYKLLDEITVTDVALFQNIYYDNFISTRQYYQLHIYYPEFDINSTLQTSYIDEDVPSTPDVHSINPGNSEVHLEWDWAHGAISYDIYYSTFSNISLNNYQGSASTSSRDITITSLTNDTSYYFIVVGVNDNGISDYNINGPATPFSDSSPSAPTNVATLSGDAAVYLSWDASSNADYYTIYYATFSGVYEGNHDSYVNVNSGTSYTIDGLTNDTTYYFVVNAENSYGSALSAEVSATPSADSTALLPPSGIVVSVGDENISITWNAVSVATSYRLYVAEESGITVDNYLNLAGGAAYSANDNSYLLGNLTNNTAYYLILTSIAANGNESPTSNEISATPISLEGLTDNYLNDTGVQFSGDIDSRNYSDCSSSGTDPQDCNAGRDSDVDTSWADDGAAGFAFTKLDSAGYELSADASSWTCVRDDVTGLIWQNFVQNSTHQDITTDDSAELCGLTGWRLPTIEELRSIVNYAASYPALDDDYFSAVADGHSSYYFWSSTLHQFYPASNDYLQINFEVGRSTYSADDNSASYMLVNSSANPDYLLERWSNDRYTDNGDGTVNDTYTQLTWMRCSLGQTWNTSSQSCDGTMADYSWSAALNQAAKSTYAGHEDWRLPNMKELASLVEHTSNSPAINSEIFPSMDDSSNFWSATPDKSLSSYSWTINFDAITVDDRHPRTSEYHVRLVRSNARTVPAAPYGLSIEAGDQNVALSWQPISSAVSYKVYRASDPTLNLDNYSNLTDGAVHDAGSSTTIKLEQLNNDTRYYFLVTAIDSSANESAASARISAAPQLPLPDDLDIASGDKNLTLSWTQHSDTTLGVISYNLYRSSASDCDPSAISNCAAGASLSLVSSPFTDNNDSNGLANGIRYYYWLEAIRGSGASQESQISENPVSAIPAEVGVVHHDFAGSESDANFYSTPDSTPWYVDYSTGADGTGSSFRSGIIGDNSSSCVETYPRLDIGTLNFYYKIESESGADKLFFYVNDSAVSTSSGGISEISGVSGSVAWTQATYSVASAANYVLKWCYTKDASDEFGADAAWIDQLSFSGSADSYDPENLEMPLNDTGINWGGNSVSVNNIDCSYDMSVPQDCDQGRDADSTTNTDVDGHAGFSFTKLDDNGGALDASATSWYCVQDNTTGLIWEVKTDDGGLHGKDYTYTWYDSDESTNGGAVGELAANGNTCYGYTSGNAETYCNTEAFVNRVNDVGLCGSKDWRMPDINELSSIVNFGRHGPSIDTDYFLNTGSDYYWTASPDANNIDNAWRINFYDGSDSDIFSHSNQYNVRLVRSKQ